MGHLTAVLQETTLAPVLLAAIAGGLVLGALSIVLGALRGRHLRAAAATLKAGTTDHAPHFAPITELSAVVGLLLGPVMTVVVVSLSRSQVFDALFNPDPAVKFTFLAAGIASQLNGICLGAMAMLIQLPLSAVGLGLALAHRARAAGLRRSRAHREAGDEAAARAFAEHPGPAVGQVLLVTLSAACLAAAPLVYGVLGWGTGLIRGFSAVAAVDPAHKAELLLLAMQEAQAGLDRWLWIGAGGMLTTAVLAAVLLVFRGPWRRRRVVAPALSPGPALSGRSATLVPVGCLLGAGASLLLAWPLRQENLSPLPVAKQGNVVSPIEGLETPALAGPDKVERGPTIGVSLKRTTLESVEIEGASALQERLQALKRNWALINPDRDFPGAVVLQADRRVRAAVLLPHLRAASGLGYRKVTLAFVKRSVLQRPRLGPIPRVEESGVRLTLVDGQRDGGIRLLPAGPLPTFRPGKVVLDVHPQVRYGRLAEAVVHARRAGEVKLLITEPEPAGP
jgi:hypothetical protein